MACGPPVVPECCRVQWARGGGGKREHGPLLWLRAVRYQLSLCPAHARFHWKVFIYLFVSLKERNGTEYNTHFRYEYAKYAGGQFEKSEREDQLGCQGKKGELHLSEWKGKDKFEAPLVFKILRLRDRAMMRVDECEGDNNIVYFSNSGIRATAG